MMRKMVKVIAIGDVHADWRHLWSALKASYAATHDGKPSQVVLDGRYRVILIGDLVHPKTQEAYEELTGRENYDWHDVEHLRSASKAQARELYKIKNFVDEAEGGVSIILGNHDAAALDHNFLLGTAVGLTHAEFDETKGGLALPQDLQDWMRTWQSEVRIHGVQFAHAGPTPGMASYDDFFYGDPDTKRWWHEKPFLVTASGHKFGVYGHTVMKDGILIDEENRFAMIDALEKRQYLDMMFQDDGEFAYRIAEF